MKKILHTLLVLSIPLILLAPVPAYAHAFGQRYDLPIPLSYFMAGAAATVALSFVVIGLFLRGGSAAYRYPRLNLFALPGMRSSLRVMAMVARALSVLLFALVFAAALFGSDNPLENIAPTFIWIIWWVGLGYISALFGNLWMLINPWKTLFEFAEWLLQRAGAGMPKPRPYPESWDMLPALFAFLLFVWLENVYPAAIAPAHLAVIIVLYSVYTFGGMTLFGKHVWLRYGDPFSALFGIFARFSPTEARVVRAGCAGCKSANTSGGADSNYGNYGNNVDNGFADGNGCVDCYECFERAEPERQQFNLRPWAAGLVPSGRVSWQACAFVVLALAAVSFDGLQETTNWLAAQTIGLRLLGPGGVSVVDTLGVVLIPLLFMGIYLLFCIGIRSLGGERASVLEVARAYVYSLVPIALAYNMAHFLSLLLVQGQLIIPLASDPFGFGWDIFGIAGYRLDPTVISTKFAWIVSIVAIVVGHVVSVYIAHTIALRRAPSHKLALRGQYPMLALMVFYTAVSLWIISQPIVAE